MLPSKPVKPHTASLTRGSTVEDYRAAGAAAAAYLRANPSALIEEASHHINITARSWRQYMADPGDKYEAFRAEVEPVYFERFKRDLGTAESEIQAAVNLDSKTLTGVVKWHTWKLEKLHARVVGTNGQSSVQTNIQVNANGSIEIKQMSHEELLELAK